MPQSLRTSHLVDAMPAAPSPIGPRARKLRGTDARRVRQHGCVAPANRNALSPKSAITDIYWARSRVLEYLNFASGRMSKGVTPKIGPNATGVG